MYMKVLDLHGVRHNIAAQLLEETVNRMWSSNEELQIITGHSEEMKKIVVDILLEYKLEYKVGDYSGLNTGYIKTYLD